MRPPCPTHLNLCLRQRQGQQHPGIAGTRPRQPCLPPVDQRINDRKEPFKREFPNCHTSCFFPRLYSATFILALSDTGIAFKCRAEWSDSSSLEAGERKSASRSVGRSVGRSNVRTLCVFASWTLGGWMWGSTLRRRCQKGRGRAWSGGGRLCSPAGLLSLAVARQEKAVPGWEWASAAPTHAVWLVAWMWWSLRLALTSLACL